MDLEAVGQTFLDSVVLLVAANGFTTEMTHCVNLCRDTRSNETLKEYVHDEPRGAQRRTRLMFHSARGNLAGVLACLRVRANVSRRDARGKTALVWACEGGHTDVVRALIAAGANIRDRDADDKATLLLACAGGHMDLVRMLINNGAHVNPSEEDDYAGYTPLCEAAGGGHEELVRLLLDAGADIDAKSVEGTALCWAAAGSHQALARELLARGAAVEVGGEASALAAAADGGLLDLVRDLVESHGAEVDGYVTDYREVTNDEPCTALKCTLIRTTVRILASRAFAPHDHWHGAVCKVRNAYPLHDQRASGLRPRAPLGQWRSQLGAHEPPPATGWAVHDHDDSLRQGVP